MALPYVRCFLWSVPVAIATTDLLASVIRIDGQSMAPTLNPDAASTSSPDYVFVEKVSIKWFHQLHRGAVVVLWAPDKPHESIIKRVVALEGDVVFDDQAKRSCIIPPGRCWIEGDNAAKSGDSRTMYGPVHVGLLEGRATHVVWPPWRFSRVPEYVPEGRLLVQRATPAGAAADAAADTSLS